MKDRVKKGKSAVLYNAVFVSTLLFNCQAWTNLLLDDIKKLETTQLMYLKRILRSPLSTTNCFVFLELGVLPLSYIIHIRQLSFLHHILLLEEDDPVRLEMSRDTWKQRIKKQVTGYAFQKLTAEAKEKTKTKHLTYTEFIPQPYIFHYNPKVSSTIFKVRSRNVECKANRKSTSKDMICRLCHIEEETQEHIVNCPVIRQDDDRLLDLKPIMEKDVELA